MLTNKSNSNLLFLLQTVQVQLEQDLSSKLVMDGDGTYITNCLICLMSTTH